MAQWPGQPYSHFTGDGSHDAYGRLPDGWQCSLAANSAHLYYYNAALNITQWERPVAEPTRY